MTGHNEALSTLTQAFQVRILLSDNYDNEERFVVDISKLILGSQAVETKVQAITLCYSLA
jgi:hypothetical protein